MLVTDPELSDEQDMERMMQLYINHLEQVIRRNPEQWFWMHRRWKTKPPSV
jgi:KDO2-lipid IV(A) lauroyltransferase